MSSVGMLELLLGRFDRLQLNSVQGVWLVKNAKSSFSFLISSGLLFAATATVFAQGPCVKQHTSFGNADALVFAPRGVEYSAGATYIACVETINSGVLAVGKSLHAGGVNGVVSQNVPTANFGYYSVGSGSVASFAWASSGFTEVGVGRFSSGGGYAYLSANGLHFRFPATGEIQQLSFPSVAEFKTMRGTHAGRGVCAAVLFVAGSEFCNKNGVLFAPSYSWPVFDYSLPGHTYDPLVDMASFGNGPSVDAWANSSVFYMTTANKGGIVGTGQLIAVRVDGFGNITTKLLAGGIDVPNDGVTRLAVGSQGVYVASGNTIMLWGFHTTVPIVTVFVGEPGDSFGGLAVLTAAPGSLQ